MELGSYALGRRASAEAKSERWCNRIKPRPTGNLPRIHVGPIAAGERDVADMRSALHQSFRGQYSDVLAVDMEALGFLNAARAHQNVEALVVRGISNCIDGKSASDASGSQELAARHASAFAFEVLSKFSSSKATSSGAHPAFNPRTASAEVPRSNVAEASQPRAAVRKASAGKRSRPQAFSLRSMMVVFVLVLGALGFMAWYRLGHSSHDPRGNWMREPHPGGRTDWHRSYPPR